MSLAKPDYTIYHNQYAASKILPLADSRPCCCRQDCCLLNIWKDNIVHTLRTSCLHVRYSSIHQCGSESSAASCRVASTRPAPTAWQCYRQALVLEDRRSAYSWWRCLCIRPISSLSSTTQTRYTVCLWCSTQLLDEVRETVRSSPALSILTAHEEARAAHTRLSTSQPYSADVEVVSYAPSSAGGRAPLKLLISFGEHAREYISAEVGVRLLRLLADERALAAQAWQDFSSDDMRLLQALLRCCVEMKVCLLVLATSASSSCKPSAVLLRVLAALVAMRACPETAFRRLQQTLSGVAWRILLQTWLTRRAALVQILPLENVSGRKYVEDSGDLCERKNGNGVDINRNWNIDWGVKEADYQASEEEPGAKPFSEPETRIIRDLAQAFAPHVWLTVHSGAIFCILSPNGAPACGICSCLRLARCMLHVLYVQMPEFMQAWQASSCHTITSQGSPVARTTGTPSRCCRP
jgi:Zinc carboxypeptidase